MAETTKPEAKKPAKSTDPGHVEPAERDDAQLVRDARPSESSDADVQRLLAERQTAEMNLAAMVPPEDAQVADAKAKIAEVDEKLADLGYQTETATKGGHKADSKKARDEQEAARERAAQSGDPAVKAVLAKRETAERTGDTAGVEAADVELAKLGY